MTETIPGAEMRPVNEHHHVRDWVIGVSVIALIVAIGFAFHRTTPTAEDTSIPSTYPLHAHLGQWGNQLTAMCDQSDASATQKSADDGEDAVVVEVNFHGPGVINVDIQDGVGQRYRYAQQVTYKDTGAHFVLVGPSPYWVTTSARINSSGTPGASCTVPVG
jgi:hypothetical protein